MLTKNVEDILNRQVERELYSSNLYLSMAVWAENSGFGGVADWLYAQADEEHMHMLKFIKYINERGGKTIIPAVDQPPISWDNVKALFANVLEHEQYITGSINEIVGVCFEEKDFTTHNWVQWFVSEQIEEEASVQLIIDKLAMVGDTNMYIFDRDIMSLRNTASAAE